jgi:V8-like Glu-specific endopeptidase
MSRRLAWVLLFGAGCTQPIETNGSGDDDIRVGALANGEHREVGVFLSPVAENGSTLNRCTATLIGPRTALTAAHCVLATSGAGPCSRGHVYFDAAGTGAPIANRVKVAVRACATPTDDVRSLSARADDVAVLALPRLVSEVTTKATLARSAPAAAAPLTLFGYGRVGAACDTQSAHQKYKVVTTFAATTSVSCAGDSGAPYFLGADRTLGHEIALLVSGESQRTGARVSGDPIKNRAWILARLAESEAESALTDAR